jgi:hypothetical protein
MMVSRTRALTETVWLSRLDYLHVLAQVTSASIRTKLRVMARARRGAVECRVPRVKRVSIVGD